MINPKHISKSNLPEEILSAQIEGKELGLFEFKEFVQSPFTEGTITSFIHVWETRKIMAVEELKSKELVSKSENILAFIKRNKELNLSHWINSDLQVSFLYSEGSKELLFI